MTTALRISELEKMPRSELSALAMFLIGVDIKKMYGKSTYDKRKKALRKRGYDVSKQCKATHAPVTPSLELSRIKYR